MAEQSATHPRVWLVGAGPGAADLITVRGARLLARADCVVHDDLVDPALYRDLDCVLVDAGKRGGQHKMAQPAINALLIALAGQHRVVVRLKGGDPFVLGRGFEEVQALAEAGVRCEVVPGVTSATAAALFAGIPVTHRGLADTFCVLSAHPRDPATPLSLPPYDPARTVVLLMGAGSLTRWSAGLITLGYPRELPVALVTWAGTPAQLVVVSTLSACAGGAVVAASPMTAIVGHVAGLRARPA